MSLVDIVSSEDSLRSSTAGPGTVCRLSTGQDTVSQAHGSTLLTTQVAGGRRLCRALARRAWPCDPCQCQWSRDPGQLEGVTLYTGGSAPLRRAGHSGAPRSSDWSPSGPTCRVALLYTLELAAVRPAWFKLHRGTTAGVTHLQVRQAGYPRRRAGGGGLPCAGRIQPGQVTAPRSRAH